MSTSDVPGANPQNGDDLKIGCWAKHDDGSLMFIQSTEGGRVVYSMFDMTTQPVTEYRDSMSEKGFMDAFTKSGWTWHDKTPFDWDAVINAGAKQGEVPAHADHVISEAEKIANSRKLRQEEFRAGKFKHLTERVGRKGRTILDKVQRAIGELRT